VRFTIRDPRTDAGGTRAPSNLLADLAVLRRNRSFLLILAANACSAIGNSGVLLFTSSYFLRTYHLTLVQVGAIYATGIGIAGLAGSLLSGFLADRFAGERGRSYALVPAIGTGLACVLFVSAFTRPEWTMAVACLIPAYMMQDMKAPSLAAVQTISPPHMRATSAAVLYLAITFGGTGLGGPIAGAVSDFVASQSLPALWGHLSQVCPGGRAAAGAGAAVVDACQQASAAGVRAGLLASAGFTACASLLFFMTARVIDLRTTADGEPA
jgi:MFS family permease